MLASCTTVAEQSGFLGGFNVAGLARHHVMVVDRSGDSAVIEGGAEGQVVIRKQGRRFSTAALLHANEPEIAERMDADRMLITQRASMPDGSAMDAAPTRS